MRIEVNESAIASLLGPSGDVGRATARAAGAIRDRAKVLAPVDTGRLRNSIVAELKQQKPFSVTWSVGSDVHYAPYQEHGTGPIYPRRAPLLVFKIGSKWVSTGMTRGVPAVHYLKQALDATTLNDFR